MDHNEVPKHVLLNLYFKFQGIFKSQTFLDISKTFPCLYQEFFIRGNAPVDFRTNLQQFGLVEKSFISVHRIGKSNYEKLIHTA